MIDIEKHPVNRDNKLFFIVGPKSKTFIPRDTRMMPRRMNFLSSYPNTSFVFLNIYFTSYGLRYSLTTLILSINIELDSGKSNST